MQYSAAIQRCLGLILLALFSFLPACTFSHGIDYKIEHEYTVGDPAFAQTMGNLLGPPLIPGNSIKTLRNGDEIFPAMLTAIRSAEKTINFETFVYWQGDVANQFTAALSERARAGVKVHLIVDWLGEQNTDGEIKKLRNAGVEVCEFHKWHVHDLSIYGKLDHRTHRKLLLIDGKIGFTGGVGIADVWSGHAQDSQHWRDNHYRIDGPVVAQLQAAFCDNWMRMMGTVLDGPDYFPPLNATGTQYAQVFMSSFLGGSDSMQLLVLLSIAAAGKNIRIESAYFVPDTLTRQSLIAAAKRGVKIEIIVPGPDIDVPLVTYASRTHWGELIRAGIDIYVYQPTMLHSKLLVVDDLWTSIGSSNFDNRSFRLNAEANLNVLDRDFANEQTRLFDEDRKHAHLTTYDEWKHRPLLKQFLDGIASLMGHEL